jgi:hypothetical protein
MAQRGGRQGMEWAVGPGFADDAANGRRQDAPDGKANLAMSDCDLALPTPILLTPISSTEAG